MNIRQVYIASAIPLATLLMSGAAYATDQGMIDAFGAPAGAVLQQLADTMPMQVTLSLPLRDPEGAARAADAVSDRANPQYGHYLTPEEFGDRFGADRAAYEAVRTWAVANGFSVGERTRSRTTVSIGGTAGRFAKVFATRFASFHTATHGDGRVALTPARVPDAIAGKIDGVIGLSSPGKLAPLYRVNPDTTLTVGTGNRGYSPSDLISAYDVPAQMDSSKTETVAVFEQGGYISKDITTYEQYYHLPDVPVKAISVNGSSLEPNRGVVVEDELDIEALIGMNPDLAQVLVYVDSKDTFENALVDATNKVADDNLATIYSISYGEDENQSGDAEIRAENRALVQLQAQGITVFASSGDSGAFGNEYPLLNVANPASQPLLTSVGGTTLTTDPLTNQGYQLETVWNDLKHDHGATGGGISAIWKIPTWQIHNGKSVAVRNGGSAKMRNLPDIAADADPKTPYSVFVHLDGFRPRFFGVGGTSLSAPLWAGWMSIANADRVKAGLPRLGFLNPVLYRLGLAGTNFHDVTRGTNGRPDYGLDRHLFFKARAGYDNATGFGSIDVAKFIPTLLMP